MADTESECNAAHTGDKGLTPGLGRFPNPVGGNGDPLQYSCLENSTGKGDGQAVVELDVTEQLSTLHCT